MTYLTIGICAFLIFIFLFIIQLIAKAYHPFRKTLLSMLLGLAALGAVNLTGFFTGVTLPLSLLSLGISLAGGIPGVTMMLVLNMIVV